ncbi:MAG TPA: hypothetical protein VMT30_04110 [Candidatus Saccharimonadia bacterium]|nr:hypothetical protein [Candidatus Saccharimonadia bacterium]
MKNPREKPGDNLEFRAELLKERIYATLALLAILLTIDPAHTSTLKAAIVVLGTALSLWGASLIAAGMSYRVVMQRPEPETSFKRRVVLHSPLLAAAAFPLLTIALSALGFISLSVAVDVSIGASLLLLLGWSLLSARAVGAGRLATLVVAAIELAIGLAVVWLKMTVGH